MSNERPPIGGRRGEKHVDDVRPEGVCYAKSIEAHRRFCESLGNGTLNPNSQQLQQPGFQVEERIEDQR